MSGPGIGTGGGLAALVPEFRAALAQRGFAVRTIATHVIPVGAGPVNPVFL
jgi:hypothetical protein